jgi:hypothetical protein
MDHEGEDSHLGGTSLVELDGTLLKLGLTVERVPAVVDGAVSEVSDEFGLSGQVTHDTALEDSDEEEELDKSTGRDLLEGGESTGDGGEGLSAEVDGSWKADSGLGDEVSDNGKHGDTSVLQFNSTEAVELFLVAISNKSEGVKESERRLGSELVFEGLDSSAGGLLACRGEGSGRGDKGGGDDGLHCVGYDVDDVNCERETWQTLESEKTWPATNAFADEGKIAIFA